LPVNRAQTANQIGSDEVGAVDVTRLLQSWCGGSRESLDLLISTLYQDLKRMAMKVGAIPDDTMQATVIVNEFYLRLLGQTAPKYESRAHFFALAARVMRQIRIDHARRSASVKRGGGVTPGPAELTETAVAGGHDAGSEFLHEALNRLESFDPRKATMLDLRYFAGFSVEEISSALDVSTETLRKEFRLAEAWLAGFLGPAPAAQRQ
jgi:RNA polymerase sigma factor (TIGR02999 family)